MKIIILITLLFSLGYATNENSKKKQKNFSGKFLYNKLCYACHGVNAEKKAFETSNIISGWSVKRITAAINGYKSRTYGTKYKELMHGQVKKLKESEIKLLAEYISDL